MSLYIFSCRDITRYPYQKKKEKEKRKEGKHERNRANTCETRSFKCRSVEAKWTRKKFPEKGEILILVVNKSNKFLISSMCPLQFRKRKRRYAILHLTGFFARFRPREAQEEGTIAFDTANEAVSLYREIITRWISKMVILNPQNQSVP